MQDNILKWSLGMSALGIVFGVMAWVITPSVNGASITGRMCESTGDLEDGRSGCMEERVVLNAIGAVTPCGEINSPEKCATWGNFKCVKSGNGTLAQGTAKWDPTTQKCTFGCTLNGATGEYTCLSPKSNPKELKPITQGVIDEPDPTSVVPKKGGNLCQNGERCGPVGAE